MKLLVQPRDGVARILTAIHTAKTSIEIVIFRFNRVDIERALHAAIGGGVTVHALIAHTNHGGEGRLRELEQRLLGAGVTVQEAVKLFEADCARRPYVAGGALVVSPENARMQLSAFISKIGQDEHEAAVEKQRADELSAPQ